MVHLYRFNEICNILNDISGKVSVSNKTEVVNLIVFNTITKIN